MTKRENATNEANDDGGRTRRMARVNQIGVDIPSGFDLCELPIHHHNTVLLAVKKYTHISSQKY
jgi:hypothetical protein